MDKWQITWDEYKELDYFCRQYARKKIAADDLLTLPSSIPAPIVGAGGRAEFPARGSGVSDPVARAAERREKLLGDVQMIERAARLAAEDLAPWLLCIVTRQSTFQRVIATGAPCSARTMYRLRRKFFAILRDLRNP